MAIDWEKPLRRIGDKRRVRWKYNASSFTEKGDPFFMSVDFEGLKSSQRYNREGVPKRGSDPEKGALENFDPDDGVFHPGMLVVSGWVNVYQGTFGLVYSQIFELRASADAAATDGRIACVHLGPQYFKKYENMSKPKNDRKQVK